jgi:hypothetical protein
MARWFSLGLALLFAPSTAWGSSFNIGVGFTWHRTELGTSTTGLLVIELPLGRMAKPRVPYFVPRGLEQESPAAGAVPPPSAPEPRVPLAPSRPETRAQRLLEPKFARKVVRAALAARGTLRSAERLDGLASRSRAAAALPELTLRALRSNDQSLRLSPTAATAYDYTQTGGAGLLLEARAVWRLDRLVFADEELRVERLRAQQLRASERLVALVLKQLFTLQQARAKLDDDELAPDERLRAELQLFEASAALDVLTDGAFADLDQEPLTLPSPAETLPTAAGARPSDAGPATSPVLPPRRPPGSPAAK